MHGSSYDHARLADFLPDLLFERGAARLDSLAISKPRGVCDVHVPSCGHRGRGTRTLRGLGDAPRAVLQACPAADPSDTAHVTATLKLYAQYTSWHHVTGYLPLEGARTVVSVYAKGQPSAHELNRLVSALISVRQAHWVSRPNLLEAASAVSRAASARAAAWLSARDELLADLTTTTLARHFPKLLEPAELTRVVWFAPDTPEVLAYPVAHLVASSGAVVVRAPDQTELIDVWNGSVIDLGPNDGAAQNADLWEAFGTVLPQAPSPQHAYQMALAIVS